MAKVISIFTQKGGVGKTTTASNLMAELTYLGKKVLGIDIDAQGNLTNELGVKTKNENTLLEVLSKVATFEQSVVKTKYGDVLGSDRNLQVFIKTFSSDVNSVFALSDIVDEVGGNYDFIIIDCPPSANEIAVSSLIASDYVIVPSELEYFSANAIKDIALTIEQVKKKLNKKLKVIGVLIVKYKGRRVLTTQMEEITKGFVKKYLEATVFDTKISDGTAVPCSQAMKMSLRDYDSASACAKEYESLAQEMLARIMEE